jgi:hypothetical protein
LTGKKIQSILNCRFDRPAKTIFQNPRKEEKVSHRLEDLKKALKDFFFGATAFEIQQTVRQEKLARLDLILLFSFGDLLGVPVFPSYYSLRLLPYFYPALHSWKKRMLKEKDLTEISSL